MTTTQNPINNLPLTIVATGNTTGATSSGTLDMRSVSISGLGGASVGFSNSDIIISAPATSALSFVAIGNTTGNTSSTTFQNVFSISGASGDSVGFNGNTIIISGGGGVGGGGTLSLSAVGNTTASTSSTSIAETNLVISGAGNLSVGYSANTVVLSGASAGATQSWSAIGNTTASTSSTSFGTGVSISGAAGASVGFSGQSIVISAPQGFTLSDAYYPMNCFISQSLGAIASANFYVQYVPISYNLSISRAEIAIQIAPQTSAALSTGSWSATLGMGIYTNNAGTLSTVMPTSSVAYSTSWSSISSTSINLPKAISVPFATVLTPGNYWIAFNLSTATGANLSATQSLVFGGGASSTGALAGGIIQFSSNLGQGAVATLGWPPFQGTTVTTSFTLPPTIAINGQRGTAPANFLLHLGTTNFV